MLIYTYEVDNMKMIKRLILLLLIIFVVVCAVCIRSGYDKYKQTLADKPVEAVISELTSKENYTVYEDIPQIYVNALVAVEDRRFYIHNGFDIIGSARAILRDIKAREMVEGGSTISQQLAKNLYFPQDNTLTRKIAEIFMAVKMEQMYDKEQIIEFYVNAIYYGSGYYSLYDASVGYFGKKPSEMSDFECTLLAGIPNAPSVYSLDVSPDLAKKRQNWVLQSMVSCDYITEDTAEKIRNEH